SLAWDKTSSSKRFGGCTTYAGRRATHDLRTRTAREGEAMILYDRYTSEINFRIETDWNAGYKVALGDEYSGYVAETTVGTFDQACAWLRDAAINHYP